MKSNIFVLISIFTITFFVACKKDETPAKPVITILELGEGDSHSNSRTAVIGEELHMEIDVVAEGKIDIIQVKLHHEGDHHVKATQEEWELDTTYTKFSGLKNTLFHEHIEIDASAEAGDYHFDFIVTDKEGNQSSAEAEVELVTE